MVGWGFSKTVISEWIIIPYILNTLCLFLKAEKCVVQSRHWGWLSRKEIKEKAIWKLGKSINRSQQDFPRFRKRKHNAVYYETLFYAPPLKIFIYLNNPITLNPLSMRLSIYTFIFSIISLASLAQREAAQYSPRVTGRDSILLFHTHINPNSNGADVKGTYLTWWVMEKQWNL